MQGLTKFARDWFAVDADVKESEERKRMPRGIVPMLCVVTLSLMLCVCATVMVSRASADVSSLEDKIDALTYQIGDLEGKLEVKNNMLDIKHIAVEQYGMISAEYASDRYIDIREDESIIKHDSKDASSTWLQELLEAIGFDQNKK